MRYITYAQLKEGMTLAEPLYGAKFEILHGAGIPLGAYHIQRIGELDYPGVYISDGISAGITVPDLIPRNLRVRTIKSAKEILREAENKDGARASPKITRERQHKIIGPVVDALRSKDRRLYEKIDLKPNIDYSYYHAASVLILSLLMGVETGMSDGRLHELGMAALLHDVGNAFIPSEVLNKAGKLSPQEFELVKTHAQKGFDYMQDHFDVSTETCMGAFQHHENYNGTGYPNRLKKDKISLYARIIAVADVFDALTSYRPFRQPAFPPAALDFMDTSSGVMFDPEILNLLKRVVAPYPTGICVELSSGMRCLVEENYLEALDRPKLRAISTPDSGPVYVDLLHSPEYRSEHIMQIIEL